jgi:hypothetical protein
MAGLFVFTFAALLKILIILYIICFGCYVLFTRQPDYFDGEITTGIITQKNDSLIAIFSDGSTDHPAKLKYPFLHKAGEKVKVIYERADPSIATVYAVLGYWITFGELIASLLIVIVLYYVSVSITSNPTPEALIEEIESAKKKPRKSKYDL